MTATAPLSLAKLLAALSLSPPPPSSSSSPPSSLQLPPQPDRQAWAPMTAKNLRPPSSIGAADGLSVTNPALSNATILFYKSGHYNVLTVVRDEPAKRDGPAVRETEESVLYHFNKEVRRAGLLRECRRRMFFENKREEKLRKHKEAARKKAAWKNRRRHPQPQAKDPKHARERSPKRKEVDRDDDDNWDLPEEELPYCSNLR